MKVLHAPIEIAGQIGVLCGAWRRRGEFASGYNFFSTYLDYKDFLMNADQFEMGGMFEAASKYFDLFHYHYGLSIFPEYRDIQLLRSIGKPVVMHHWGSDVRTREAATMMNRYVYTGDCPDSAQVHRNLKALGGLVKDAIVQDHEVYAYVSNYYERVHVVPIAINLGLFEPKYPELTVQQPMVVHAPTNQEFKGTALIEKIIKQLQGEIDFRYVRVDKMPHHEAIRMYQQADVIVDQILCGSYGLFSVEGMAYGKPVIAYIREDLAARYEGLPIHNANPDTIYDVLKHLLTHPEVRHSSGIAGRAYVERVHNSDVVIGQISDIYQLAMSSA